MKEGQKMSKTLPKDFIFGARPLLIKLKVQHKQTEKDALRGINI